jgi:ubiquinone/menaquinone biosynthesis C-methylase UbiE
VPHKFNYKHKHRLNSEERRKILPPESTLTKFGLHDGDIVADIGCGIGYFTIPAANIVGSSGKIYALDILDKMINEIKIKLKKLDISNVETVLTEENNLKLQEETVTFAFISNVLHEAKNKEKFLSEVKKIICSKGRIAIIEWKKGNYKMGPPMEDRLDKEVLVKILDKLGFINISTIDIAKDFYGLIAERI